MTIQVSSGIRPARVIILLRRLLARDDMSPRHRPPISLPGRPAAAGPVELPSSPSLPSSKPRPLGGRKPGWVDGDSVPPRREQERQPDDVLPPYPRDRLAAMNNKFVHRLERAFESGSESRASAASSGGHRMAPIALTDAQLATLRQFATPIPPSLRDAFLRSLGRRLATVEVGDGAVHAACAAAQREVIDGARVCE